MRELPVRGSTQPALVDDEDFDRVSRFTWRISKNKNKRKVAYVVSDRRTATGSEKLLLHREVLRAPKGTLVDHKNRDGLDNRKNNLRAASNSQNQGNRVGRHDRRSQYKGVVWDDDRQRWRTSIQGRKLGRFKTEMEAALAYDTAAKEVWGEFARLNFPE